MTLGETLLKSRKPRKFLPESFDATSSSDVKNVLLKLQCQIPTNVATAREWFGLFQETSSALTEAQTLLELSMQRNTQDKDIQQSLQSFDETILSEMLSARQILITIYLNSPWKFAMHADDGGRIEKDFRNRNQFSSNALVELQIEENRLVREYRQWISNAKTTFRGRETPLSVVIGRLSDHTSDIRKEAFTTYWSHIEKHEGELQQLFDKLLDNRNAQANAVKASSYVPLAYSELGRIDYSEQDCEKFRAAIHKHVVPVVTELAKYQAFNLKTKSIKPWDLASWPQLNPQKQPGQGSMSNVLAGFEKILKNIHPSLADLYKQMQSLGLVDISPGINKAPGAFTVTFQESGLPFIFGNFSASYRDVITLVHEFGHAAHGHLSSHIDNILMRTPGLEFCELAAIGLELLSFEHFDKWWSPEDAKLARSSHIFSLLHFWPFMAMMDEFQHQLYATPNCNAKTRNELWLKLSKKYRPHIDWSDCEQYESLGWFSRQHIFTSPFYYIDYGIAQLGAVQLWLQSQQNYSAAVRRYIQALGLGAQRPLAGLFQALGADLDFSGSQIADLTAALKKEILKTCNIIA